MQKSISAKMEHFSAKKSFAPWLKDQTKVMMNERDACKADAISLNGKSTAKIINEVNNKRKFEEINFKKEKINQNLDCPTKTWQTAKEFMNWESKSGPPHQLSVRGRLVTKASEIATEMNTFFINKVRDIRDSIMFLPNTLSKCTEIMRDASYH